MGGPLPGGGLILGLLLLFGSGELLVYSGGNLAQLLGISDFVISAVLVALGTSLPELAAGLAAVLKKKDTDLIVGNLLGSNIFNVAFILASLGPYGLPLRPEYLVDALTILGAALFLWALGLLGRDFGRGSAALFLALYFTAVFRWITQ